MHETDKKALEAFSRGKITGIELRRRLGGATYGEVLQMLSEQDLPLPRAPETGPRRANRTRPRMDVPEGLTSWGGKAKEDAFDTVRYKPVGGTPERLSEHDLDLALTLLPNLDQMVGERGCLPDQRITRFYTAIFWRPTANGAE